MKKMLVTLTTVLGINIGAHAQSPNFQKFKLDVGGGLDLLSNNSASITFTVEPHYRFTNPIALGLRFQGAVNLSAKQSGVGVYTYSSQCLTGDYYTTNVKEKVAMFVGGGAGVFTELINNNDTQIDHFGFFPRVGLETGRFRASLEYNVTGGVKNYFSINAGVFFWGKRK